MNSSTTNWVPEILYEEGDSSIPFIQVPDDKEMPGMLFVFESKTTGEIEPGLEGEEVPIVNLDLYQYANMKVLKEKLTWAEYDNVRFVLGLEPLKTAAIKGQKITSNIRASTTGENPLDNT